MSDSKTKKPKRKISELKPFVSVCTPTFNRRHFIPIMFECFRNQDYDKTRMEWIIVDDGTDKIKDLVDAANIPQIKYFPIKNKMPLGAKRNYMHTLIDSRTKYIIYQDDDDYYPFDRVSHAVEMLESHPEALCAGSSELYVYFKHIQKMYQFGPYSPTHSTAGTFAFRKELLGMTRYDDHAELAEEKNFLKDYNIPFVQLDPMKTILVFSHEHNTFDKRKLLQNPHPQFVKESTKTVDEFFRLEKEEKIKHFFMHEIDKLLQNYEQGEAKNKPGVLLQIEEIEKERKRLEAEMMEQQRNQQNLTPGMFPPGQIMLERPNMPPVALTQEDIVNILRQNQQNIMEQQKIIEELNKRIEYLLRHNQELESKCRYFSQFSSPEMGWTQSMPRFPQNPPFQNNIPPSGNYHPQTFPPPNIGSAAPRFDSFAPPVPPPTPPSNGFDWNLRAPSSGIGMSPSIGSGNSSQPPSFAAKENHSVWKEDGDFIPLG